MLALQLFHLHISPQSYYLALKVFHAPMSAPSQHLGLPLQDGELAVTVHGSPVRVVVVSLEFVPRGITPSN